MNRGPEWVDGYETGKRETTQDMMLERGLVETPAQLLLGLREAKQLCADYIPEPHARHRALKAIAWAMAVADREGLV